jgi:alcohol dehydrogenase
VTLEQGDRVTWTLAASCGECFYCDRGLPQKCETLFKYGHAAIAPGREFSGGFAEYCLLQAGTGVVKLPETLSDESAAPANCAVATVAAAHRLAGNVDGASVLVLGCGVLGLNAAAMASHSGAARVIACDVDPARETLALAFGADVFVTPENLLEIVKQETNGRGADVAMEFSGAAAAVVSALASLRTGGIAIIAGTTTPGGVVSIDPNDLVRRMLTVKGLHNYAPEDLVTAIDFLVSAGSRFPFEQLQGDRFPLDEIEAAFARSTEQGGRRVSLIP